MSPCQWDDTSNSMMTLAAGGNFGEELAFTVKKCKSINPESTVYEKLCVSARVGVYWHTVHPRAYVAVRLACTCLCGAPICLFVWVYMPWESDSADPSLWGHARSLAASLWVVRPHSGERWDWVHRLHESRKGQMDGLRDGGSEDEINRSTEGRWSREGKKPVEGRDRS